MLEMSRKRGSQKHSKYETVASWCNAVRLSELEISKPAFQNQRAIGRFVRNSVIAEVEMLQDA